MKMIHRAECDTDIAHEKTIRAVICGHFNDGYDTAIEEDIQDGTVNASVNRFLDISLAGLMSVYAGWLFCIGAWLYRNQLRSVLASIFWDDVLDAAHRLQAISVRMRIRRAQANKRRTSDRKTALLRF